MQIRRRRKKSVFFNAQYLKSWFYYLLGVCGNKNPHTSEQQLTSGRQRIFIMQELFYKKKRAQEKYFTAPTNEIRKSSAWHKITSWIMFY